MSAQPKVAFAGPYLAPGPNAHTRARHIKTDLLSHPVSVGRLVNTETLSSSWLKKLVVCSKLWIQIFDIFNLHSQHFLMLDLPKMIYEFWNYKSGPDFFIWTTLLLFSHSSWATYTGLPYIRQMQVQTLLNGKFIKHSWKLQTSRRKLPYSKIYISYISMPSLYFTNKQLTIFKILLII